MKDRNPERLPRIQTVTVLQAEANPDLSLRDVQDRALFQLWTDAINDRYLDCVMSIKPQRLKDRKTVIRFTLQPRTEQGRDLIVRYKEWYEQAIKQWARTGYAEMEKEEFYKRYLPEKEEDE